MSKAKDDFKLEFHGNAVVITPAANVESMRWDLIEQAADIVMSPMRNQEIPMVVFDLSDVAYFGSVFLALLLRCQRRLSTRSPRKAGMSERRIERASKRPTVGCIARWLTRAGRNAVFCTEEGTPQSR
jgi:hypothetical protein